MNEVINFIVYWVGVTACLCGGAIVVAALAGFAARLWSEVVREWRGTKKEQTDA